MPNVSVEGMQVYEWTTDNLKKGRFWNNNNPATNNMGSDNAFYGTTLFTKETLPVGSVIEINDGWLYRAEYWHESESGTKPRGPMVGTYRIVVTEEFWNGISDRGFNISTTSKDTLSTDDWDEVATAFKIYIPVN